MLIIELNILIEELRITDLTPQKKNKERISVYLNGQFAFGLSLMAAANLQIGQLLTSEEIDSLKNRDEIERGKTIAYRYLSYRPRSIAELKRHLIKKGYEETTIDRVLERLTELDLIDDDEFARYWVEQRETFNPRGLRALRYELRQKGVERQIIEKALTGVDETVAARKAAQKRARLLNRLPEDQFKQKLSNFLQRRGFNYDVVRDITQEFWISENHTNKQE